jgi:Ca-activated chloride channel family protein
MPSISATSFAALVLLVAFQQVIRVDVSLVTVGVRVTDSRGRDVSGLKAKDFSISEDGVPRDIAFFSNEPQAITLGIVVDRSSSMAYGSKLDRAKDAARALVNGTREGSEFFYIEFDEVVNVGADFTSDRQNLISAIQRTVLGGGTSLYEAILKGLILTDRAQLPRRALVVISDGADQHSTHKLSETIRFVRESEIQIFTIGYFSREEEQLFRASTSKMMRIDGKELDNPLIALEKVAEESGGDFFFPRSDKELAEAVSQISEDLRTQYTLAFYPRFQDRENRYHELRVNVRNRSYKVRARPGYGTRPQ